MRTDPNLSHYDATGEINLRDPAAVERSIKTILGGMYGGRFDRDLLERAMADLVRAYRGEYPGLLRCDTLYHDLRHALETGLTMARILNGHARTVGAMSAETIDADRALLGVILALYHDIGLLRRDGEAEIWGASLTPIHEERGVEFLRDYLAETALAPLAEQSFLIMPTKLIFKIPDDWRPVERRLGSMIAASDILSQMADRCYIEKCRDFLFLEFSAIGLAGGDGSAYPDRETLLAKTPGFFTGFIAKRLEEEYSGIHHVISAHFGGRNPYEEGIERNLAYLGEILATQDYARLRRRPQTFIDPD
jgi:hypothetical protein